MVDDDLSGDGEQKYFKYRDRCVQVEHADQLDSDDQVKACREKIILVGIGAGICQLVHGEGKLYSHDDDRPGEQCGDYEFQYLSKVFQKKVCVFFHARPPLLF